ncbi:hypothetical protein CDAR_377431 [Caerostris darwini]|uniref:Uncharacterized protein n=1 Tax=Caerostris darwini TaxID=1538125 RepID=A0AAV4W163_9ARAC|nr:hypothetical protein CDAR_377431 [Caerostris darwini]
MNPPPPNHELKFPAKLTGKRIAGAHCQDAGDRPRAAQYFGGGGGGRGVCFPPPGQLTMINVPSRCHPAPRRFVLNQGVLQEGHCRLQEMGWNRISVVPPVVLIRFHHLLITVNSLWQ